MAKDNEVHGLLKLPDEVVIKQLRQELGVQNSYIAELEDEITEHKENIKLLSNQISEIIGLDLVELKQVKKQFNKELMLLNRQNEVAKKDKTIKELSTQIRILKDENDYLMVKSINSSK